MGNEQPPTQAQLDAYHRAHPFTLPEPGDAIVSPLTGTRHVIGAHFNQGNFGEVFYCTDDWGDFLVAKVIRPAGNFVETETRALSEIMASGIVRSHHVVQIHDAFIHKGACYIISERCASSLRDFMAAPYRANVWFRELAKGVLHALHYVHVNGLGHCDVHAGNVFLQFLSDPILEGQAACFFQLGDFGQARPIPNMNPTGTFWAPLRPPEALDPSEFGPLDHRSDIYQAGLLLLNFLSGQEFTFTIGETLAARPRLLAEALPHPAGAAIAAMLRRHTESRPPTARDAWLEIQQALRSSQ